MAKNATFSGSLLGLQYHSSPTFDTFGNPQTPLKIIGRNLPYRLIYTA